MSNKQDSTHSLPQYLSTYLNFLSMNFCKYNSFSLAPQMQDIAQYPFSTSLISETEENNNEPLFPPVTKENISVAKLRLIPLRKESQSTDTTYPGSPVFQVFSPLSSPQAQPRIPLTPENFYNRQDEVAEADQAQARKPNAHRILRALQERTHQELVKKPSASDLIFFEQSDEASDNFSEAQDNSDAIDNSFSFENDSSI